MTQRILLNYLLVLVLTITLSYAYPSPSTPVGSTTWNSGDKVTISWSDSGSPSDSSLSGICISLMTGPDLSQIFLETVTSKLDNSATSTTFTVPPLSNYGYPPGKIYFLMFSDSADPTKGISWSTRFTILDGSKTPPVSYTPGAPWTITPSGGSPATTASSNATASSSSNSTTTNTLSTTSSGSASSNSTTTQASSSYSNKVVVTAYVTPTPTGNGPDSATQNANPNSNSNSNSSSNSGSIMSFSLWSDGILIMIACVASVLVI